MYLVVFLHVHLRGGVCSGFPQSHVWGMCSLSVGLGEEEEPRDSRAQRRDSGRQTDRQPARAPRPQDCSGWWWWSSGLTCYMLPECPWLNEACALTHSCKPPHPNSHHSPPPGLSLSPFPRGHLLKSDVHSFTETSVCQTSS